jgi:hypothetical protein
MIHLWDSNEIDKLFGAECEIASGEQFGLTPNPSPVREGLL